MIGREIGELIQPPDFEIRAEAFIRQLKNTRRSFDDPDTVFIENRTKMLAEMFGNGLKFLSTGFDTPGEDVSPETRNLANRILESAQTLESILGESLEKAAEELDRQNDIDSATHTEVEVTLVDDSKKRVRDFVRTVDLIALQNGGMRDWENPKIIKIDIESEPIVFTTSLDYIFR